jgi:hypothetical protein
MRSGFWVIMRVEKPSRETASEASMPACPPPTTMQS